MSVSKPYNYANDKWPKALEDEKQEELLKCLSEGKEYVKDELILGNMRLVCYIAKKYSNTGVEVEDLISIGTIGLIKAINTYKIDKGIKLATYATRCIENEILMYLRKNLKHSRNVSIEEAICTDRNGNSLYISDIIEDKKADFIPELQTQEKMRIVLSYILNSLPNNEKLIMLYKLLGKTQKKTGEKLNISQSYVSRLIKKIGKKIRIEAEKKQNNSKYKIVIYNQNCYKIFISKKSIRSYEEFSCIMQGFNAEIVDIGYAYSIMLPKEEIIASLIEIVKFVECQV